MIIVAFFKRKTISEDLEKLEKEKDRLIEVMISL